MAILPSQLLAAIPSTAPFVQVSGSGATWSGNAGTQTGTITAADRAILVWNPGAFSIATGETFNFAIGGGAVLNKVGYNSNNTLGATDTAVINGSLSSNGKVFILANGNINIGNGAQISSTGGLYLSTLLESSDFQFSTGGNLAFSGNSTGAITIGAGGAAVNSLGTLGAWSQAVTINGLSVTGDLIVSQNNPTGANATLTLSGPNVATTVQGGNLTAITNNGIITQNPARAITVGGTTNLNTNGNKEINLNNVGNSFGGTVQVATTGNSTALGGNVTLVSAGNLTLGTSTVGQDLSASALSGSVTTVGVVATTGNATLNATGGNVAIGNNSTVGGSLNVGSSTGAVSIATAGNLTVGNVNSTQTATSGGISISSSGIVTLNGTINPGAHNSSVTAASINSNATASVTNTATATFNATSGNLVIPATTATAVTANSTNGSISQVGIITSGNATAGGSIIANAGTGNVTLTNNNAIRNEVLSGVNVSTTSLTGRDVSLTSTGNIIVGVAATGNATISTVPATYGTGNVTLGGGGGSAAFPFNVGGNLVVNTNGGNIEADTSSRQVVEGSITANTAAGGIGGIGFFQITNGGSGYTAAPTITTTGTTVTGFTGGTGTVVMNNGTVVGITVSTIGKGYSGAPTITLSAPTTAGGTTATATVSMIGSGNVTFGGADSNQGTNTRYGQFNANGEFVTLTETTTLNLGNITANRVSAVSTSNDIVITGNVSTAWVGGNGSVGNSSFGSRANSGGVAGNTGAISETTGSLNIGGTARFETPNNASGTVNLTASNNNLFGGTVTITNGSSNIIHANSNITFTPGNVTAGSVTINTINTNGGNRVTLAGGQHTDVRINSVGEIVLSGNIHNRNLTLNTTSTSANAITQTGNLSVNNTLTITSAGTTKITSQTNGANNMNVVLANVTGAETTIYGGKNVTLSGNSTGNVTVIAGTAASAQGGYANPWNLILGTANSTLNVAGLNGVAMNGNTPITGGVTALNLGTFGTGLANGGSGYTAAPTVTVAAPTSSGGTTATATATVVGGVITGFTITSAGSGYTSAPTVTLGAVAGATAAAAPVAALTQDLGHFNGGLSSEGNSGNITQGTNSRLHVENLLNLATFGGDIVVGNNGNSNGRVQLSTGGLLGLAGNGNITYTEDSTAKIGNIHTNAAATLTSRFGSVIEDPVANVTVTAASLTARSDNGSVQLGGATRTTAGTTTTGNVAAASVSAPGGSAQLYSTGNIALGSIQSNSLTVTSLNQITQTAPARVFGSASFTATNNVALTDAANNFGPISVNVTAAGQNIAITEAGTLNLRSVTMVGGSTGTFTATSVNGDIVDSGLSGVVAGGRIVSGVATTGSGVVTLSAANGNITIDDPTTDFPTTGGLVLNAKNASISVLGQGGSTLVLGASGVTSNVTGNFTATSALGDIANAGNIVVGGDAFFQTGTKNITLGQLGNSFGTLKFVGNQIAISQAGDMKIVTGSQAIGPAQLTTNSGNITIVNRSGLVSFGNTVALNASGSITLPKLIQSVGVLTVQAAGTKDLSALSYAGDLNSKAPVNLGLGTYIKPPDAP